MMSPASDVQVMPGLWLQVLGWSQPSNPLPWTGGAHMNAMLPMWKEAYREAPFLGRVQILYMVIGMPVLAIGSLVHLARFL